MRAREQIFLCSNHWDGVSLIKLERCGTEFPWRPGFRGKLYRMHIPVSGQATSGTFLTGKLCWSREGSRHSFPMLLEFGLVRRE
jgi:hypothetical protein